MQATSVPNQDGSSTIFIHTKDGDVPAPVAADPPPQPMVVGIPFGVAMPQPQPVFNPNPWNPWGWGNGFGFPFFAQQQQAAGPTVIIVNNEAPKPEEKKPVEKKPGDVKPGDVKPVKKKLLPRDFSHFSIISAVFISMALVLGSATVLTTYHATDSALDNGANSANERYMSHRAVALGLGTASTLCFTIATLTSFLAGMRTRNKDRKHEHCCQSTLLLGSWIVFAFTFLIDLVILALAFDEEQSIYPEWVVIGYVGSTISWACMFGYSEMARRDCKK